MRLLADENVHPRVVAMLREAGHDVERGAETSPGASDRQILARPDIGSVILITYDRDFGDLIFHHGYPAPLSILYSRLGRVDAEIIGERLLALLDRGIAAGQMITLTKDGERTKPFPTGADNG